jgi:hypothetical protein
MTASAISSAVAGFFGSLVAGLGVGEGLGAAGFGAVGLVGSVFGSTTWPKATVAVSMTKQQAKRHFTAGRNNFSIKDREIRKSGL